uniref:Glutathione peroxidase n=1 Tax=Sinocyclocheilus rhinocerous TaxID=307959 RepID=A0A673HJP3_9TELE
MEALGGYPTKPSASRAGLIKVLVSVASKLSKSRKAKLFKHFYPYEVKDVRGRTASLEKYRGKVSDMVSLVVNVASGRKLNSPEHRALQELHRELGTSHLNVLAFPCSQYGDTESGTSREIEAFAKSYYGVTFPIFSKIKIMGSEAEPASSQRIPKWNFWKFLVSPEGQVVRFWKPEEPIDEIRKEATALVQNIILKKRQEL